MSVAWRAGRRWILTSADSFGCLGFGWLKLVLLFYLNLQMLDCSCAAWSSLAHRTRSVVMLNILSGAVGEYIGRSGVFVSNIPHPHLCRLALMWASGPVPRGHETETRQDSDGQLEARDPKATQEACEHGKPARACEVPDR